MIEDVILEIEGRRWTAFKSIKVTTAIDKLSGLLEFETVKKGLQFPFANGESVKVFINGEQVLDGYLEYMQVSHSSTEHNIIVHGRDKTADIVDSTIGGNLRYSNINLIDVAKNILKYLNITDIQVFSDVEIQPFGVGDLVSGELGETAFEFLERYAQKRQILITTDGQGNIVFTRSSNNLLKTKLIYGNRNSNILDATATFDNSSRFYKYVMYTQANPSAIISTAVSKKDPKTPAEKRATWFPHIEGTTRKTTVYDRDIRQSRTRSFILQNSDNIKNLKSRAVWEANIRRAKAFSYSCTVVGFVAKEDNILWRPNMLVQIIDADCLIHSNLITQSVNYEFGLDTGSKTTLEFLAKDALDIEYVDAPVRRKKKEKRLEGGQFGDKEYDDSFSDTNFN